MQQRENDQTGRNVWIAGHRSWRDAARRRQMLTVICVVALIAFLSATLATFSTITPAHAEQLPAIQTLF
jgi:hypothetical protein